MAGVRIYTRGKIVTQTRDFNISTGFTGEFKLRSYLTGAINAEWLDEGDTDLIRTDRQDIIWTSEKGEALQAWGQALLRKLASKAEPSTRREIWTEFKRLSRIENRLAETLPKRDELQKAILDAANIIVRNLSGDALTDTQFMEDIVQLAYVIGPHKQLLESLRTINEQEAVDISTLLRLFETVKIAETHSLGRIAAERVRIIERLGILIRAQSTTEHELQKLIETATWLISPEWTPIAQNQSLNTVRKTYEDWYSSKHGHAVVTSTINNPGLRPDFVLYAEQDLFYVVEIKRPGHELTDDEFDRALEYRDSLSEFIAQNPGVAPANQRVKLIIVCDHVRFDRRGSVSSLETDDRIERKSWHALLQATRVVHRQFINAIENMPAELPTLDTE